MTEDHTYHFITPRTRPAALRLMLWALRQDHVSEVSLTPASAALRAAYFWLRFTTIKD